MRSGLRPSKTTAWQASILPSWSTFNAQRMKGFYCVYILVSETDGRLHYSGLTRDLNTRLAAHNRGKCPHIHRSTGRGKLR